MFVDRIDGNNVFMRNGSHGSRLHGKPFASSSNACERRVEHLQRNVSAQCRVHCTEHDPHSAATDDPLDFIVSNSTH